MSHSFILSYNKDIVLWQGSTDFARNLPEEKRYHMNQIEQLQEMIDESHNIVFFGGAGVSTESNIPDFRSADGLYQQQYKYSPEQIVSHSFFMRNTEAFYEFYKEKMMFLDAKPNPAHYKLAELEAAGKLTAVITQNIDGLHQAAGSKNVLELHGSIHRNYCMRCGKKYDAASVIFGSRKSAENASVFIFSTYRASKPGYSLPLSAIAGSTIRAPPDTSSVSIMCRTWAICPPLPR